MTGVRLRILAIAVFALLPSLSNAQAVLSTLNLQNDGFFPQAAAVNTVTNKIYVANWNSTVSIIDGATNQISSLAVVGNPLAIAVNSTTNKIYVPGQFNNNLAVIDGNTNGIANVSVGNNPVAVAVNPVTNKIYVVNSGDNTVTVVDGATNQTATVAVGADPHAIAVNSVTNKIYVVNVNSNTLTTIDGATNSTSSMILQPGPTAIAVNPVTNRVFVSSVNGAVLAMDGDGNNAVLILFGGVLAGVGVNSATNRLYVVSGCSARDCDTGLIMVYDMNAQQIWTIPSTPNYAAYPCLNTPNYCPAVIADTQRNKIYVAGGSPAAVTVIDGATNTAVTLGVGDNPTTPALNPITNRLYVPSYWNNTVTVIAPDKKLQFVPIAPCRVVDTRKPDGTFGGPALRAYSPREFPLPQGACNLPANAVAYSLNATVVPHGSLGYLSLYPSSQFVPPTSTLNSIDGRIKANAAIVQGGIDGGVEAFANDLTDLILDVNGYFIPASSSTLAFFPLPPCRVADTRKPDGELGGPPLQSGVARTFPVLDAASCDIPSDARAYSLNFTAIPNGQPLAYLTVWPTGQQQPLVSTLNDSTGTVVANAAILPAGTAGAINVLASDNTNLAIDINGYFASASSGSNPLSLYTLKPCRPMDTRQGGFNGELVIDAADNYGACPIPATAQAYTFNATVVPSDGYLAYLSLWPDGQEQPVVSTLNALDGAVTSNMAIVPTTNGLIDAYATNLTRLLLDISSYFAP